MFLQDPKTKHIVNRLPQEVIDSFYVVTSVFNPWRYRTRIDLYRQFREYVETSGAKLMTVELALGERPFVVTERSDEFNLQLRSNDEMWFKERMLNLGIEHLPLDCKYIAWVDADVRFARPDWVNETVQLLQHYPVIQMFSKCSDLSPDNEVMSESLGIINAYHSGIIDKSKKYAGRYGHPGFAWAARREALNDLGGLFDTAILGSADYHMARALIGSVHKSHPSSLHPGYIEQLDLWQDRATQYIKGDVGYMSGHLFHYWHGKKVNRRYKDRWQILVENQYDPEFDLKRDTQGLHKFTDRNPKLRQDIRKYFLQRLEDDVTIK